MSLTRLLSVARKELLHILRDSRSLFIVVIMPVALMLLFGYGVSLDLKGIPLYIYDQDGTQQSQDLLKHFQASQYFHIVRVVDGYPAITRALEDGSARMESTSPCPASRTQASAFSLPLRCVTLLSNPLACSGPPATRRSITHSERPEGICRFTGLPI